MYAFVFQHIDALISTAAGLCLTVYSWRRYEHLRTSPKKAARALPYLAPFVVVFGLFQFIIDAHPAYVWQRASTNDGQASAEFPCTPKTESAVDSAQGVSIKRVTVVCNVPQRDINLRLSYNEIPPEGAGLTVKQRMEGVLAFFNQQGSSVDSCEPDNHGDIPGFRLVINNSVQKAHMQIRLAIMPKALYRAVATSSAGFHDDPVITRFLDSFALQGDKLKPQGR